MNSLSVVIKPVKDKKDGEIYQEFRKLEIKKGLNGSKVGKLLADKHGTKQKIEASLYGFFKRGERSISESRVNSLAEIFEVDVAEIRKINLINSSKPIQLNFDPKLDITDFLPDIPPNIKTLDEFLVWLSLEDQRKDLILRLST